MPDVLVAVDVPVTIGGGEEVIIGSSTGEFAVADLITAARAQAKAVMTEIRQYPEALPAAQHIAQLALPYMIILAGDPRADKSFAVQDTGQWIPIDFIYIAEETATGVLDQTQALRVRLGVLASALKANHTLGGICVDSEITETPADRLNRYFEHFRDHDQAVAAMVLTAEFLIIDNSYA